MELNNTWVDPRVFYDVDMHVRQMVNLAMVSKTWRDCMQEKINAHVLQQISSKVSCVSPCGIVTLAEGYAFPLDTLNIVPGRLVKVLDMIDKLRTRKKWVRYPKNMEEMFDNNLFVKGKKRHGWIHTINFFLIIGLQFEQVPPNHFLNVSIFTMILGYMAKTKRVTTKVLVPHSPLTEAIIVKISDALFTAKTKRFHRVLRDNLEKHAKTVRRVIRKNE